MAVYTTIDDPSAYFKVQLYTGNGSDDRGVVFDDTDTDMQPDFVWIKNRETPDAHELFDSVRGVTKELNSGSSDEEITDPDTLTAFDSDGFTVDDDFQVNTNAEKYVAWCWKESATAGFDIVAYTGTGSAHTESHSLSAVPHSIFVKQRTDNDGWRVYHHKNTSAPETDHLILDTNAATADDATTWNDTAPTSSVFTVGTSDQTNESTDSLIAYLFSEKQGFSKFGGYTGNANADGTFVYLGFKPAFFMLKRNGGGYNYYMYDNKRFTGSETANPSHSKNNADEMAADGVAPVIDFLSNGVKIRSTDTTVNSAVTHVYWAFAEAPLVNSSGVPNNAE